MSNIFDVLSTCVVYPRRSAFSVFALVGAFMIAAGIAAGQTITFESPTYTIGNINGQDGWIKTGPYDSAVSSTAFPGFGGQSLRVSNAVTSGSFGDMTFSRPVANEAGETTATNGGVSGGARQNYFSAQFSLGSTVVGAQQPGLLMSMSPDRGDGARMSYLRYEDLADGIHVFFDDFVDVAPLGVANGDANGCGVGDDFVETDIATLTRTVGHTIRFVMFFVDGPHNDIVQIYIDGVLVKTGTSWEDYYRYCSEQSADNNTHTVDSLLIRNSGPNVPANMGNGLLFDNMTIASSTAYVVDDDGAGTSADCDDPTPTFLTIQSAVNAAANGDAIKVCPGTYNENVNLTKNLTMLGAQAGVDARGRVAPESVVTPANPALATFAIPVAGAMTIDGFSFGGGAAATQGIIYNSVGPNDGLQILNNRMSNFSTQAIWLNRGGQNITIDKNVMDGSGIAGGSQVMFFNGPQIFHGLYITNNNVINSPSRAGVFVDGINNVSESATRAPLISGNLFDGNSVGVNLGSRSFGKLAAPVLGVFAGTIIGNTFSNNAFDGVQGGIQHVLVAGNRFLNNGRSGIALTSFGNTADPARGAQNSTVSGNLMSGNGFAQPNGAGISFGVQFAGTIVTNQAHYNRIIGNNIGAFYNGTESPINIENNWWGCNYGPGAGGAGCSAAPNGNGGTGAVNLDANPWLTLTSTANPGVLGIGETSAVTSKLTINSDSVDTFSGGTVQNGIASSFTAVFGTVSPTGATLAGATGTTFTATAYGLGGVDTTIDSQTTNAPINVNVGCRAVSIPDVTSLVSGAPKTVSVNTDDLTDRNVLSADLVVTYNTAVLNTPSVSLTPMTAGATLTVNTGTPGTIIISVFRGTPFTGAGALVDLTFNVVGLPGSVSPLSFTSFKYNEDTPCSGTTNGSITVIGGTITGTVTYGNPLIGPPAPRFVPNVTVSGAGSPPVSALTNASGVYSLSGFGPGSYTRSASKTGGVNGAVTSFDAARIAQYVVLLITLTSNQLTVADVSGTGGVSSFDAALISRFTVLLPSSGSAGNWIFTPATNGPSTVFADIAGENYTALLMGDVSGNWNAPTSAPGGRMLPGADSKPTRVDAASVTAPSGSEFVVPVNVRGTTGREIIAYQYELRYDPAVIQPNISPVDTAGTISDGMLVTANAGEPGLMRVSVFGAMPLAGDGVLLNLRFTAIGKAGAVSPLAWESIALNEGGPPVKATDGQVELTSAPSDQAELSGRLLTAMGEGVANTRVTITDTTGAARSILTNGFGHYRFGALQAGETYTISVETRRYRFDPITVNISGELTSVDMIAEP